MNRAFSRLGLPCLFVAMTAFAISAFAAQTDAPAAVMPAQPLATAQPWSSLSADQQQVLAPVEGIWDELAADVQQHLRQATQRWPHLSTAQRERLSQRIQKWAQLTPEQRARLHQRYLQFQLLPPDEQARLKGAFRRFNALPEAERGQLRERFERMTPAERAAFLEGAGAQGRAGAVHEFIQSVPQDERHITRAMLESLTSQQRGTLLKVWRALPVEQRETYRKKLVQMSPAQRDAALGQ